MISIHYLLRLLGCFERFRHVYTGTFACGRMVFAFRSASDAISSKIFGRRAVSAVFMCVCVCLLH